MARPKVPYTDISLVEDNVSFDIEAFDQLIRSHGVTLVHYEAAPCPIGVTDQFDSHAHTTHDGCSNGFLYDKAGEMTAMFSNNANNSAMEDIGILDGSTCMVTIPRTYDDTDKEISVQIYDRFFVKDFQGVATISQKFEYNTTGLNRLRYPAITVEFLMDNRGNRYTFGNDFTLVDGNISWTGIRRPGYDAKLEKGDICSIRFRFRPYFYVKTILHEVRVSRKTNDFTGESTLIRMPQQLLLQREQFFENEQRADDLAPETTREVRQARKSGFGPR